MRNFISMAVAMVLPPSIVAGDSLIEGEHLLVVEFVHVTHVRAQSANWNLDAAELEASTGLRVADVHRTLNCLLFCQSGTFTFAMLFRCHNSIFRFCIPTHQRSSPPRRPQQSCCLSSYLASEG